MIMATARCRFCGTHCQVLRLLPEGATALFATCHDGAASDRERTGHDHRTTMQPHGDTRQAELMATVAATWNAHSVDNAYRRAGVTTPISGDALAIARAPWRSAFYHRHRQIEQRELAAARGHLWADDDLDAVAAS